MFNVSSAGSSALRRADKPAPACQAAAATGPRKTDTYEGPHQPLLPRNASKFSCDRSRMIRTAAWIAAAVVGAGAIAGLGVLSGGMLALPAIALAVALGLAYAAWRQRQVDVFPPDKPIHEPPLPALPHPGMRYSAGAVVVNPDGTLWTVEPRNHFGGLACTFPKGRLDAGETPQRAAHREVLEEAGLRIEILGHLMDQTRSSSVTRYYLARHVSGDGTAFKPDETQSTAALPAAALQQKFGALDWQVLHAVQASALYRDIAGGLPSEPLSEA